MQKIRNRISAQESRDRKKNQFNELVNNNISLIKNSMNMKRQIDELQKENMALKGQVGVSGSTAHQPSMGDLTRLQRLFSPKSSPNSKPDWKSFSLFMLTIVVYCVLYPDKQMLKDKLNSAELSLQSSFT